MSKLPIPLQISWVGTSGIEENSIKTVKQRQEAGGSWIRRSIRTHLVCGEISIAIVTVRCKTSGAVQAIQCLGTPAHQINNLYGYFSF